MSDFTTWIRVEDDFGQFDHPKHLELPKGARAVKNATEHVGAWARPGKPRTDKAGSSTATAKTGYDAKVVADLEAEITARNEGRDEADLIVVGGPGNKPDLIAALVADDARE